MAGYEKINNVKSFLKSERTVEQIAEYIGRGNRTVFRYLELLRNEKCGLRSRKFCGQTFFTIQTEEKTSFNQDAVKQLERIKRNMSENSSADVKNRKLVDKLIEALRVTNPDEFKPEAITTDRDLVLDYGPFSDNKIQDSLVNKLLDAIHKNLKVKINYRHSTANDKVESLELNPVKVVMRIDTLYLIAADDESAENFLYKNYLVENIQSVTVMNVPVVSNLKFDLQAHYKYTFGKYTNQNLMPENITLMIKPESAWLTTQFKKSHFSPAVNVYKDKNKNDLVDMKIRVTPDFKSWLLGILPDVQIIKPESLKKDMMALLKKTLDEMQA